MSDLSENQETFFQIVAEITGADMSQDHRRKHILLCINELMREKKIKTFSDFISTLIHSESFYDHFVSVVTIHTTSWFRESDHFEILKQKIVEKIMSGQNHFEVFSAACSTGQEVYTIALVFEELRSKHPKLSYSILGADIDSHSLTTAEQGRYPLTDLKSIPERFHRHFEVVDNDLISPLANIRENCRWQNVNLTWVPLFSDNQSFDFIFCRNILIYLPDSARHQVAQQLTNLLKSEGWLFLSQSETLMRKIDFLTPIKSFLFKKTIQEIEAVPNAEYINHSLPSVLIIDDSEMSRLPVERVFREGGFRVFHAGSASEADQVLLKTKIDLITLDLNMPEIHGGEWLKTFRTRNSQTPVMIITGSSIQEAQNIYKIFGLKAQDFFEKYEILPRLDSLLLRGRTLLGIENDRDITYKINVASERLIYDKLKATSIDVVCFSSSAGGPPVIWSILEGLPKDFPPVIICQHGRDYFPKEFADSLRDHTPFSIKEIDQRETPLERGFIYLPTHGLNIEISQRGHQLFCLGAPGSLSDRDLPSADKLYESVARTSAQGIAVQLSGIGNDGVHGLKQVASRNCFYIMAQNKQTSPVWGMPYEVVRNGLAHFTGSPDEIQTQILDICGNYEVRSAIENSFSMNPSSPLLDPDRKNRF